jgi:hypothetical protein
MPEALLLLLLLLLSMDGDLHLPVLVFQGWVPTVNVGD